MIILMSKNESKRVSPMWYKFTPLVLRYFAINKIKFSEFPYFGDDWAEFCRKANESGLLTVDADNEFPVSPIELTAEGLAVSATASRDDLFYKGVPLTASENTRRTMLTFLVLYGSVSGGYYGSPSKLGEKLESLHVLSCGIDDATKTPHDEGWGSFNGTFVEADQHTGLIAEITCQCGLVSEVAFQIEVSQDTYINDGTGVASMFIKMLEMENSLGRN